MTYYLGGREVTLELSEDYLLPSAQLEHFWDINKRSLFNYMAQCMYGIRGTVTDQETGDPLRARIEVINHDSAYSVVYSSGSHGDYYRLIREGVYDLVITANGYFNDTVTDVNVTNYQASYLNVQLESWPLSVGETRIPELRLYPNPSSGILYLEPVHLPPGELSLNILSPDGRILISKKLNWQGGPVEFDIGRLENGMYFVQATLHSHRMVERLLLIGP